MAYSPTGNILSKSDQGSYTYSSANNTNPQAVTQIGTSTLSYDSNGNLSDYDSNSYTWNYRNEMMETIINTATTSYMYSHNGDRVQYHTPIRNIYYPNKYYEYDVVADKATTHIYLLGQPIANIEVTGTSSPVIYYIHRDHLGGTALTTDNSGNLAQALDYYPFGDTRDSVGSYQAGQTFTGHTYDSETDLLYMGARYYKGAMGRFFSEDPASRNNPEQFTTDPQQMNMYGYARNNPLKYVDPTGMYNVKTGEVEKGDTPDKIVNSVNNAFNIKTDWNTIKDVSFYSSRFKNQTIDQIVNKNLFVGTDITTDITKQLDGLNKSRSLKASLLGKGSLSLFAPKMPWDIKNSSDPILGGGKNNRSYWSYIYNGGLIRYDAPGNINYGCVSRSVNLSSLNIYTGATIEQLADDLRHNKGFSSSDNSGDSNYVQKGINIYNSGPWWQKLLTKMINL